MKTEEEFSLHAALLQLLKPASSEKLLDISQIVHLICLTLVYHLMHTRANPVFAKLRHSHRCSVAYEGFEGEKTSCK